MQIFGTRSVQKPQTDYYVPANAYLIYARQDGHVGGGAGGGQKA